MTLRTAALFLLLSVPLTGCDELLLGGSDDSGELDTDAGTDVGEDAPPLVVDEISVPFSLDGTGFYRMPWPSDFRLTAEGTVDLSDFPNPSVALFRRYASAIQSQVRGFAIMPIVYVQLGGDPIPQTPVAPVDTLYADGPVQLVDVSADGCGERVPIEVVVNHEVDAYIGDDVLMAAPVPGFVLRRQTPYALLVLRSLGNPDGFGLTPVPAVQQALAGAHPNTRFDDTFAPLRDCLPELGVRAEDIAVATVFTTQDPVDELRRMRNLVADPAKVRAPTLTEFAYSDDHSNAARAVYRGRYETPMLQDGTSPYAQVGGAIHFGPDGDPIIQRWESVPFTVAVPRAGTPPFELLIWVDGTGATDTSWVGSSVTREMLEAGFAVAGYTPQFHGSRATPGSNAEVHSFNFLNPDSFRNTFRQQVVDTSYFIRVMTEARAQMTGLPAIDDSRIVYAGQSQGSLVGTMVAGVESRIEAYMLNGVAAYLALTAVERTDPVNFARLISNIAGIDEDFTRFHPLMALAQTGGDASDPHAYAPDWAGWEGNPDGVDILLVNGVDDYTAPVPGMSAIAIAGDVAPIAPVGWNPDPLGVWDRAAEALPIADNRDTSDGGKRTRATFLSGTTGHFTIYDRADVRELAVRFLRSAADGAARIE